MKKIVIMMLSLVFLFVAGCGTDNANDEPENPNSLYDWDITENIISKEDGKFTSQKQYIVYDKPEAYVIALKQDFDKKTTKFYRYQLIYHKRD